VRTLLIVGTPENLACCSQLTNLVSKTTAARQVTQRNDAPEAQDVQVT
jgi:hypothetical protein